MELWSLMHFLMPHVFQSHREFKEWFSNPVTGMIEGNSEYNESIIKRLHKVLRPFLLRRLKSEVEKQMPKKYEHVVMCRLSKRQRFLYDDYMSRAKTRETLASGNLLSVINVLMQLRKVCNHPNLFEVRPTTSPFQCDGITWHIPSIAYAALEYDVWKHINLYSMNLNLILMELYLSAYQCYRMRQYQTPRKLIEEINSLEDQQPRPPPAKLAMRVQKLAQQTDVKPESKDESAKGSAFEVKPGQTLNTQANLKLKIGPQSVLQLVQHSPLKVVTHQTLTTQSGNAGHSVPTTMSLSSVLKPDKLMFQPGIAQLVQTSTGKHILLTPTPNTNISTTITIPGSTTVVTTGGQRLTLLPKQAVAGQVTSMAKGLPKIQLMSVSSPLTTTTSSSVTVTPSIADLKAEEEKETGKKTVGNKFIDKLYSHQSNSLDVRWKKQKTPSPKRKRHSIQSGEEIEITDHYKNKLELIARVNERRCSAVPLYGKDFQDSIKIFKSGESPAWGGGRIHCLNALFNMNTNNTTDCLRELMYSPERRIEQLKDTFDRFIFYVPAVHAPEPEVRVWHPNSSAYWGRKQDIDVLSRYFSKPATCLHPIASAMVTQFPDPRLIQYDCGKLQTLDRLLRRLKTEGHRVLIFTQMTKMLDVLEAFLNFHGHIYLRLDGSTKVDQRQVLMERFNTNTRIFAFILSTRSGGIGVNLTGADTVIFYDSDWNPTMDAQAQDRCHRIGQTRDVHIYRLVSERTIEENILKKANQKRLLGDLAIEGGNFTTAYFKSSTIQDLFEIDANEESAANRMSEVVQLSKEREKHGGSEPSTSTSTPVPPPDDKCAIGALENALAACEDDQDVLAARTAKAEAVADLAEFDENIPLEEQEKEKEPEISRAEQEVENLVKQLTPVERYAMRFIEQTEAAWSAEQLAAAEREIDEQKREWEQNRLAALRVEEERRARELEEENDMLTYSREDASNQVSTKSKKLGTSLKATGIKKFNKKTLNRTAVKRSVKSKALRNKLIENLKREAISDSDGDSKTKSADKIQQTKVVDVNVKVKTESLNMPSDFDDTSQTPTENSDSTYNPKVNGGTDTDFKSESEEETTMQSDSSSSDISNAAPVPPNHVDHNSPRTRSRGTVEINLWTLDVSPILPGVKPVKNSPSTQVCKKEKIKKEPVDVVYVDQDGVIMKETKKGTKRLRNTLIDKDGDKEDVENIISKTGNNRKGNKLKNTVSSSNEDDCKKSQVFKVIKSKLVKNANKSVLNKDTSKNNEEERVKSDDNLELNCNKKEMKSHLLYKKVIKTKIVKNRSKSKENSSSQSDDLLESIKVEIYPEHDEASDHESQNEHQKLIDKKSVKSETTQEEKLEQKIDVNKVEDESAIKIDTVGGTETMEIENASENSADVGKPKEDKSAGKNGKVCKVVVTDIMISGTFSKELSKYTLADNADKRKQLNSESSAHRESTEGNSEVPELESMKYQTKNNEKLKNSKSSKKCQNLKTRNSLKRQPETLSKLSNRLTPSKGINETKPSRFRNARVGSSDVKEVQKPIRKRRPRLVNKNSIKSTLDNWLLKSPSPQPENSVSARRANYVSKDLGNVGTSEDGKLLDDLINAEVTDNIAVKAEITKVSTDDDDELIKEDSLKRTCNESEPLDEGGLKTNKIIKTA